MIQLHGFALASLVRGDVHQHVYPCQRRADLDKGAELLLEHETLTGDEIRAILRGEPMPASKSYDDTPPKSDTPGGKRGSVPTTKPRDDEGPGDFHPEPQPGT